MKKIVLLYGKIAIGTFLMALAVNIIYEPLQMVTGGVSGLAITIRYVTAPLIKGGLPVWLLNFVMNIPIFIWGFFVKGKKFIIRTAIANTLFSLAMYLIPVYTVAKHDYFLAAVAGGTLTGIGLGLVFTTGNSTGGTDLLSSILNRFIAYVPVAKILFILDSVVILTGAVVFGISNAIYAIVAVYITSCIMDGILSGLKFGKKILIISDKYEQISDEIIFGLGRGVTCLEGTGMYSNTRKPVIMVVVGRRQIVSVLKIVRKYDKKAFIVVQDASEVMGEGFGDIE